MVDAERGVAVGRAGFHGPPDADGMVEVGYAVDPAFRRRAMPARPWSHC
jgi:ribosomal-protein-alanine N-acetyltransferase